MRDSESIAPLGETWRAEFEKQCTRALREKLYRVARARLRQYAGRLRHVDDADVDDAVMSVLADTLDGALKWDPALVSLQRHLINAIRFRVRDQARSRRRHPHEVLDEDRSGQSVGHEMLSGTPIADVGAVRDLCALADEIVPQIRVRAASDPEVLALLDLIEEGTTETRDLMRETKWSAANLRNVRRRLRRIREQLPTELHDAVIAALS